jgi:predicted dehydrogenase
MEDKMSSKINRRTFVSGLTQSAIGLAAAPALMAAGKNKKNSSDKTMRIGIIGGRFGASFHWHEHPNCKVTAVCDIRQDRIDHLKKTYQCDTAYKDFKKLIADPKVDAVGVFTPAPLHVYMSVEALKAGKHVISAVPAGINEEECVELLDAVRKSGKLYMMAETSFYRREIISCRQWAEEKKFGEIFYSEAEYHHDGLVSLMYEENGLPSWRHGFPPMHYPTHCTGLVIPVINERLTEVTATGWGDDHEALRTNLYNNPFWSETAMFKTDGGHSSRIAVYWHVASGGTERGQFHGTEMSYALPRPGGFPGQVSTRVRGGEIKNNYHETKIKTVEHTAPNYYELLPEPMRHPSGHGGSHTHLTHEFVSAILENRQPSVDIYEALAYTVPGFYAHQSALQGGTQLTIPDYGRS